MTLWEYVRSRIPAIAIWFVLLLVVVTASGNLWEQWVHRQLTRTERAEVFEYLDVRLVAARDNDLLFESSRIFYRDLDHVVWNDRLLCFEDGDLAVVESDLRSEAADIRETADGEIDVARWVYPSRVPADETCFLRATITARIDDVTWQQTLDTDLFQTRPGR